MSNPNTSVFPGAVAADTNLLVSTDNAFSPLSGNINDTTTDIPFNSAAAFRFPCLIALENEIVLAAGPTTGNTVHNCQRGFSGTAASHLAGVVGFGYVFAYQINQLAAEIKAIESQLGINLAGVVKSGATAAGDLSGTYPNPAVSLVGGASAANVADAATKRHTQNTDTGTNANTFQIGVLGVKVKNTGSALEVRNSADNDYADLVIKNLTVKGTTTQIDSTQVNIGDNIITLNADLSNVTTPTQNAGFEVNRGNLSPVDLIWNESTLKFQCGVQGSEHDIIVQGASAGGDLVGTFPNPTLGVSGVTAGTYGDGTHVPVFTVDAKGRVTAVTSTTITGAAPTGSAGGDLTGTFPNPTIAQVGGVTATNVASGANAANGATSANTASKLVARDSNGDSALRFLSLAHIVGTTAAPGIAADTGAGTSPSGVTCTGTDAGGKISLTTGTSPATGANIVNVTFATAFASAPSSILLSPAGATAAALTTARPYIGSISTTGFSVIANAAALTGATAYSWFYIVIG